MKDVILKIQTGKSGDKDFHKAMVKALDKMSKKPWKPMIAGLVEMNWICDPIVIEPIGYFDISKCGELILPNKTEQDENRK